MAGVGVKDGIADLKDLARHLPGAALVDAARVGRPGALPAIVGALDPRRVVRSDTHARADQAGNETTQHEPIAHFRPPGNQP